MRMKKMLLMEMNVVIRNLICSTTVSDVSMYRKLYGDAAANQEGLLDPSTMLDVRLLEAFQNSDLKKFRYVLSAIIETVEPKKRPYAIFSEIMYKAATLGRQGFCDLLEPHASHRDYLDGILNFASSKGNVEAMEYLVRNGADPRNHGDQPLRSAVIARQQASVDYLQKRGCDLSVAMNPQTLQSIRELRGAEGVFILAFLSTQTGLGAHANHPGLGFDL